MIRNPLLRTLTRVSLVCLFPPSALDKIVNRKQALQQALSRGVVVIACPLTPCGKNVIAPVEALYDFFQTTSPIELQHVHASPPESRLTVSDCTPCWIVLRAPSGW